MDKKKIWNIVKLLLKISITGLSLYLVSKKVELNDLKDAFSKSNSLFLFLAFIAFVISQLISSSRLNTFFKGMGLNISEIFNFKIYLLGMFYNLFLPGSIGGDAYKVVRISRVYDVPYKKTAVAVLLDRFSGLFALILLTSFLWAGVFKGGYYSVWVVVGGFGIIPVSYLVVKKLFPYFERCFAPTYLWGLLVQLLQVVCMFCILKALHVTDMTIAISYLLLFMISSVVAVLPFTVGGLGGRELVFLWGAQFLHLDVQQAVAASLLFYFITVLASAVGFPFVFADPLARHKKIEAQT